MPVSGFKIGDAVRTPAGHTGKVTSVTTKGPPMARVRLATGPHKGQVRRFRQAALRAL